MRKHQHILWAVSSCAIIIWAGTQSWAYQDEASSPVGLTDLIPAYAPDGLTEEDFQELSEKIDETWKDWTLETGQFVKEFYEGENATIEAQEMALEKLRVKLNTMEKSLKDPRYSSIHQPIGDLYAKLLPRVDVAEAVLETLTSDRESALKTRSADAVAQLNRALSNLRADMRNVRGGQPWLEWAMASELDNFDPSSAMSMDAVNTVKSKLEAREEHGDEVRKFMSRESFLQLEDALAAIQESVVSFQPASQEELRASLGQFLEAIDEYRDDPTPELSASLRQQFDEIRNSAPDGGSAISDAFASHFMNYNLRIAVAEGMLNRIIGEVRNESSRINDSVAGARVVGNQSSRVNVSVDVQPSNRNARFNVRLDGTVQSNSMGYTSQATIRTTGYHTFVGVKPIIFDGTQFMTEPAQISVSANNRPVGASTRYSGGLFGNYADRVAMREAWARIGQANSYTARNIRQEVGADLDPDVDRRFSEASMELQNRLYGPLREYGLYPDSLRYTSTESEIRGWSRLTDDDEIGGSRPVLGIEIPRSGLVAQIHQSLLTNGTNRLDLGTEGKMQMSEGELRAQIEERLSKILDRDVDLGESEDGADGATFIFDEPNPIHFIIDDGEVILSMRAGLDRGDDVIPTQIITVPLMPSVENNRIVIKRGNVGVRPVERPSSIAEQVARANVMRQKIQAALPERDYDTEFKLEREEKTVTLHISSITADNGWLTLVIE